MQEQALSPGMLLDVVWPSDGKDQSWVGRVRRISPSAIIGEPLARLIAAPPAGTAVRLTTAVGSWATSVISVGDDHVVLERPAAATLNNRRASLRVRVQSSAQWRPHRDGPVYAVFIEDLSLQGVRILSERVDGVEVGSEVIGMFSGYEGLGEVRSVQPHVNDRLAYYGVRFASLPRDLERIVTEVVGQARRDPANWL